MTIRQLTHVLKMFPPDTPIMLMVQESAGYTLAHCTSVVRSQKAEGAPHPVIFSSQEFLQVLPQLARPEEAA